MQAVKSLLVIIWMIFFCFSLSKNSLEAVWSSPTTISSTNVDTPQIGIDAAGNAVAVWQGFDGANDIIQAATLPLGGSWSSPVNISLPGLNAELPQIAVDPAGNAIAVWEIFNGTNFVVQAAILPFGGSWSLPVNVSLAGISATSAQVSVDFVGNAVATWTGFNGTNFLIQAATLPFGGSWTTPVNISPAGQDSFTSEIAVDPSGNAVVVWRLTSVNLIIQAATLPFGGSWTAPVNVSLAGQNAVIPQVAVDSAGNAVAVWQRFDGANEIIQSANLPFGGSWTTPVNLSSAGQNATTPEITVDPAGNAVAVWQRFNGANDIIQAATLLFGGSWSAPTDISAPGENANNPQIANDANGNAIAVWERNNGIEFIIQAAMLPFGGSWSTPTDLSSAVELSAIAQIAMAPTGYAVVDWRNITLNVIQAATWTPPPGVTNVNPNIGFTIGGNQVTITGTNFLGVSQIAFGSINAVTFTVVSPTVIKAIVPAEQAGTVDVRVITFAGISPITFNDRYTYIIFSPAPPKKFHGILKQQDRKGKNYLLRTSWHPPRSAVSVAFYKIYENKKVIKKVKPLSHLHFKKHVISKHHLQGRYRITAIYSLNDKKIESKREKLKIVKVRKD